jgi:hypothetical protein
LDSKQPHAYERQYFLFDKREKKDYAKLADWLRDTSQL